MCGGVRKSSSITLTLVASVAVTTNVSRFVSHVCGYSITAALTVGLVPLIATCDLDGTRWSAPDN